MDSSNSLNRMRTTSQVTHGQQQNSHLYDGIALCKAYAAVYGRTPASMEHCDKFLRENGIDPARVPGYRVRSTAPSVVARPDSPAAKQSGDKADTGSMRRALLEGPGPLGPMCDIAYNSSVAELREIVERMGLAMTSSSLFNVSQAIDSNGGNSVLQNPELFDVEQAILLKHCIICLDKDMVPTRLYPILGALHSIAKTYHAVLVVHTDVKELSSGRCVGNLNQPTCREETFDPCAPQELLERLDKQHAHTELITVIPVFISDASNLKLIEGSYPNRSMAGPSNDSAPIPRVTLTIREYAYRTPQPECQPKPAGGPTNRDNYGLPLALSLSAVAAVLIGVGFGIRERVLKSRETAAQGDAAPDTAAETSVTTTVANAGLDASTEGSAEL